MALYTMNLDGSGQTQVALPPEMAGLVWDPAISPDGDSIVFSYYGPETADLYLVKSSGSNLVRLTTGADSYGPHFSPDGSKIVFIRYNASNLPHVWMMNRDGSGLTDITLNEPYKYDSAMFSPNGTKIVAFRDADPAPLSGTRGAVNRIQPAVSQPEPNHSIVTMNLDGTSEDILETTADDKSLVQFSPDGQNLIYAQRISKLAVLSQMLAQNSSTVLTPPESDNYDPLVLGKYVFFVSTRDGNSAVYRMNADGSGGIRLTDPAFNSSLGRAVR